MVPEGAAGMQTMPQNNTDSKRTLVNERPAILKRGGWENYFHRFSGAKMSIILKCPPLTAAKPARNLTKRSAGKCKIISRWFQKMHRPAGVVGGQLVARARREIPSEVCDANNWTGLSFALMFAILRVR